MSGHGAVDLVRVRSATSAGCIQHEHGLCRSPTATHSSWTGDKMALFMFFLSMKMAPERFKDK